MPDQPTPPIQVVRLSDVQEALHCQKEKEIETINRNLASIQDAIVGRGFNDESLVAVLRATRNIVEHLSENLTLLNKTVHGNGKAGLKERLEILETDYHQRLDTKQKSWAVWLLAIASMLTGARVFLWDHFKR